MAPAKPSDTLENIHKYIVEVSHFMGKIDEAVSTMKTDITGLGGKVENLQIAVNKLCTSQKELKRDVQIKTALATLVITVVAQASIRYFF